MAKNIAILRDPATDTTTSGADDGVCAFLQARPRLFGIAFRISRNAAEAEDIVQDVWIRWQKVDRSEVRNPLAFLATTTTRLATNVLQSARVRREIQTETWTHEPVDSAVDPMSAAERNQAVSAAVTHVLETLLPTERAALVLREAFDHSYREIATLLRVTEANARQLVTRARGHVSGNRRSTVDRDAQRRMRDAFVVAAGTGDVTSLARVLLADAESTPDRAGPAPAPNDVDDRHPTQIPATVSGSAFPDGETSRRIAASGLLVVGSEPSACHMPA